MNTRPLSQAESDNLTALNEAGLASTLLFITATSLHKAILDATEPMREMFHRAGIHSYATQSQGEEGKVTLYALLIDRAGPHEVKLSLYRPKTKQGDPRMWLYSLGSYAGAEDVLAVFIRQKRVHAINLTRTPLGKERGTGSVLDIFFQPLWQKAYLVADELLQKLRAIAAVGPLPAECVGDTAVGRTIETALGIKINSEPIPDYKGIEIKSGRSSLTGAETRANLFACVPDWSLSTLKSSAEILNRFGYQRGEDFKLYCTVSTRAPNPQGLQLNVDSAQRWLREIATKPVLQDVVIWKMATLEERLKAKHPETFWVKVQSEFRRGKEHFLLKSVIHTRNPNLTQLERMLTDGTITLDHLIKRQSTGRTAEKGPLFKIERRRIRELFLGEPKEYSLIS